MRKLTALFSFVFFVWCFPFFSSSAFAHEQYVLTQHQFGKDMQDTNLQVFSALSSPENALIALKVGIGITILFILTFFFQHSRWGRKLGEFLDSFDSLGHLFLRVALAVSLFASAYFSSFMGPEIPLSSLPFSFLLLPFLYATGILLLFGLFTRIAATIGLGILLLTTYVYGEYVITYLNYFGEYIALIIFGSYAFSLDNKFFGISTLVKKYQNLELFLIRVTYGISVMYPAVTIKFLHPAVIVDIATRYKLAEIHWLFPSDPLLISLGTGIAQVLVGAMIIIGFQTRLASLITFFLYGLSILYFKEAVWPHYILLSLALYLVVNNGGKWTLDKYFSTLVFVPKEKKLKIKKKKK